MAEVEVDEVLGLCSINLSALEEARKVQSPPRVGAVGNSIPYRESRSCQSCGPQCNAR